MNTKDEWDNIKLLKEFCERYGYELSDQLKYWRYWDDMITVTELLSLIIDPWFEFVKTNLPDKLKKACDRWTRVHKMFETWIVPDDNILHAYNKQYKQWLLLHDISISDKEKTYYKDNIRWTIDAVLEDGTIVDYKSSMFSNIKYNIQIWWYAYISGLSKWSILYINNKEYDYVDIEDIEYYKNLFKWLIEYSEWILKFNWYE